MSDNQLCAICSILGTIVGFVTIYLLHYYGII